MVLVVINSFKVLVIMGRVSGVVAEKVLVVLKRFYR